MLVSIKRLRRDTNEEVNPKWQKLQESEHRLFISSVVVERCSFPSLF